MKLKNRIRSIIATTVLALGLVAGVAVPAEAGSLTRITNVGSYNITVQNDNGTTSTVGPGATRWGVRAILYPSKQCITVSGPGLNGRYCNNDFSYWGIMNNGASYTARRS